MDDALLYGPAVALAHAIRGKQVSVTEVVEAHLQRIRGGQSCPQCGRAGCCRACLGRGRRG